MMQIKIEDIISRAKLILNAKSDIELSKKIGKSNTYINSWKQRNTIDFGVLFDAMPDVDFNWLVTGDYKKNRLIAEVDERTGRKIVDLNEEYFKIRSENEKYKNQIALFSNILKSQQEKD